MVHVAHDIERVLRGRQEVTGWLYRNICWQKRNEHDVNGMRFVNAVNGASKIIKQGLFKYVGLQCFIVPISLRKF